MRKAKGNYNFYAGLEVHRTEALADGVFAIAMTLLVLNLSIPFSSSVQTDADLMSQLLTIGPKLLVYLLSFITLGIFWTGHSAQYTYITRSDRHLNWLSIFFLMFVVLIPYTTIVLSEYIMIKFAIVIYWLNIGVLGIIILAHLEYAYKSELFSHEAEEHKNAYHALRHRIIWAQTLYAIAAALCFVNTYLSIAAFVAIQLNYALAPTFRHD